MNRRGAAAGSTAFLVAAPGSTAVLVPWLLTRWRSGDLAPLPVRAVGLVLVVAGAAVVVDSFARFVREGRGTPAPVAPTGQLVVTGAYRYVRNPMYVAVASTIVGQALLLGRWVLLVYAAAFVAVTGAFVHWYEAPALARLHGSAYADYRRRVPGWLPVTLGRGRS